jgi:phosphoribosylamine--glycine ligase
MVGLRRIRAPDFTIVGPELPLSLGIVDALRERGVRVFGPTRASRHARIEQGVRQAVPCSGTTFPLPTTPSARTAAEVEKAVEVFHPPIVVKADGLAAGKGVVICDSRPVPLPKPRRDLLAGALLGETEQQVIIEEFLEGDEVSFLCLSDGKT